MAFPQVQSITETTTSSATVHNISLPATVNAGDLLVMLVVCSSTTITGTPSGWTAVRSNNQDPIYAKVAAGTEGGGTVALTTSDSQNIAAQVYRITDWYGEIASGAATAAAQGNSTTPNPPSLNPSAWGTEDTLWIASAIWISGAGFLTYPSGYSGGIFTNAGTPARLASARRNLNAASTDPGTFSLSLSGSWRAHTIAIRPVPAAFEFTGSTEVSFDGTVNVDAVSDIVFTGSGALDFDGTAQVTQIAVMDGAEEVSFDGTVVLSGGALLLVGDGDVSFDGTAVLTQDAVFEGFGDVTMNGLVSMGVIREFAASQSVSFDGSANLTAIGWQEVDIASSQIWTVKK